MPKARTIGSFCLLLVAVPALAQIDMPDPSQMAGRAIPAPELPDGTVSVRLVREALGNNISGHDVAVVVGSERRAGKTDQSGRAQIAGLSAGASATAEAVVDGERVVSQPFQVPATGGIRVILIAGLKGAVERKQKEAAAAASAPPVKGTVVFGSNSRLIFEFQNDRLSAFYLLDIVNTARTRVDTGGPLIIDLPSGAAGTRVMEGSFAGATAQGDRVTVAGPFPPGTSSVQIGFQILYSGSTLSVRQKFPVSLQRVTVFAERVGDLQLASPQFTERGDTKADDGTVFLTGSGSALPAGGELNIELSHMPQQSTWPRNVALALAAAIVAAGAWLAFAGRAAVDTRRTLIARRDSLLGELAKLEQQHRRGRVDEERYSSRRKQLLVELERIYAELDDRPGTVGRNDLPAEARGAKAGGGGAAA